MTGTCINFLSKVHSYCTGNLLNVDGGCFGAQQIQLVSSSSSSFTSERTSKS
jgi:hypothetical protein